MNDSAAHDDRPAARRRLLTVAAAADHAACSEKTIRRAITAGRLQRYGLGRTVRVDFDELMVLLDRPKRRPHKVSAKAASGMAEIGHS